MLRHFRSGAGVGIIDASSPLQSSQYSCGVHGFEHAATPAHVPALSLGRHPVFDVRLNVFAASGQVQTGDSVVASGDVPAFDDRDAGVTGERPHAALKRIASIPTSRFLAGTALFSAEGAPRE
jgi:hypothetical protein